MLVGVVSNNIHDRTRIIDVFKDLHAQNDFRTKFIEDFLQMVDLARSVKVEHIIDFRLLLVVQNPVVG